MDVMLTKETETRQCKLNKHKEKVIESATRVKRFPWLKHMYKSSVIRKK